MKRIFFIILQLLILQLSFSQENFVPGYIIDGNNDTIQGYINYRNWKTCPEKISFKNSGDLVEKDVLPSDIKGFMVSDKIYVSAFVKIEISPINTSYLEYNPDFRFITDTVFLQARFRGVKNLYLFIDNDRRDYFYFWNDTSFTLLEYKRYLVKKDNQSKIFLHENKRYIGQLTYYLRECPALAPKIETTGYYTTSIEKLYREYAKCTGDKYEFIRKNGRGVMNFS